MVNGKTNGKTKVIDREKSEYLLTILFKSPFFARTNIRIILTYLIPYADGNGELYENSKDGFERKIDDINNNRIGGQIQNAASQGISFRNLYSPCVTFPYYYEQLNLFSNYIKNQFDNVSYECNPDDFNIESENLRNIIFEALSLPKLYYKRKHEIWNKDKLMLLQHLNKYGNQYVMAELLYYITSKNHELPDVEKQILQMMQSKFSPRIIATPNVALKFRSEFDENSYEMEEKLAKVKELQILCFSGSSFFDCNNVSGNVSFYPLLVKHLEQEKDFRIEIILEDSNSQANTESTKYKISPYHLYTQKNQLSRNSVEGIKKLQRMAVNRVHAKTTKLYLPYSICIFHFLNPLLDYIKLDLYSPLIPENGKRPSAIIFKKTNLSLFEHFESVFLSVWNNEQISDFI